MGYCQSDEITQLATFQMDGAHGKCSEQKEFYYKGGLNGSFHNEAHRDQSSWTDLGTDPASAVILASHNSSGPQVPY